MRVAGPNVLLVAAAVAIVGVEAATRSQTRYGPECLIAAVALAGMWRTRDRLRMGVLIAVAIALPAALAGVHLAGGVPGDIDVQSVYPTEGRQLLDGTYPHSEYPPGAVVLFAVEDFLGSARSINPFVMALAEGAVAWAIASTRSPTSRWLGAVVALWPANAFFWEFKFDALPTALLLLGLVFALRERWALAGVVLGVGAAVKWTPALACLVLCVWLLADRRPREATRHLAGFLAGFGVIVLPFLLWAPNAVWSAVSRQAPRGITPEALWYLPLHAFHVASQPGAVYDPASVPSWANAADTAAQAAVLLSVVLLVAVRRPPLAGTVAVAAVTPALFLILNKVFSAQYLLTIIAGGCLAAALVGRALLTATLLALAAAANVLVYPIGRYWQPASALMFAATIAAIVMLTCFAAVPRDRFGVLSVRSQL